MFLLVLCSLMTSGSSMAARDIRIVFVSLVSIMFFTDHLR